MARYLQRISLLGKERWIGWEMDGVGTEIPGLTLADDLTEDELIARGVKEFHTLTFESFIGMGAVASSATAVLLDEDITFRLDALGVGIDRFRAQGMTDIPRSLLVSVFGGLVPIDDPRVQQRFHEWERDGFVRLIGEDRCYLRVTGRLA